MAKMEEGISEVDGAIILLSEHGIDGWTREEYSALMVKIDGQGPRFGRLCVAGDFAGRW